MKGESNCLNMFVLLTYTCDQLFHITKGIMM